MHIYNRYHNFKISEKTHQTKLYIKKSVLGALLNKPNYTHMRTWVLNLHDNNLDWILENQPSMHVS